MKNYIILGVLLLCANMAFSQEKLDVEIKSIDIRQLSSPNLDTRRSFTARSWTELDVEFELTGKAPRELASNIRVDFYLILSDRRHPSTTRRLRKH